MEPAESWTPTLGPCPVRGGTIVLRAGQRSDLGPWFEMQREPAGRSMLGFGAPDPNDREDYDRKWSAHLANDEIRLWAILWQAAGSEAWEVVGQAMTFYRSADEPLEVGYALSERVWGRGIATAAVGLVLAVTSARPLAARCIHDNLGSIRVLEKHGFEETARATAFGNARGQEVQEILFRLRAEPNVSQG